MRKMIKVITSKPYVANLLKSFQGDTMQVANTDQTLICIIFYAACFLIALDKFCFWMH